MGYTVIGGDRFEGLGAVGTLYRHDGGAEVLILNRPSDDNKVFAATFRTPPEDDGGAPHIVEHCVLSGSKAYPAKDTFNELAKGSLHTFLNAMTYDDFTCYPIASRNGKDFFNLARVYMDAVFCPLIYERETTFLREGWHYETEGGLRYNGIVYNEMKGAYSDPRDRAGTLGMAALFPNTAYRFSAGGDPKAIPDLTRERFLAFHREHYTPGNCLLYFYGDVDNEACLALAAQWLDRLPGGGGAKVTGIQAAFEAPVFVTDSYGGEEGNFLSARFVTGTAGDARLSYGLELLERVLFGTEASPLKRKLVAAGIGSEVWGEYAEVGAQPTFSVNVKGAEKDGAALWGLLVKSLKEIVAEGLDEGLVNGVLNRFEFESREEVFGRPWLPKGLTYQLRAVAPWAAGAGVFSRIDAGRHIPFYRQGGGAAFVSLINEYFLNNNHAAIVTLTPDAAATERLEREEAARLAVISAKMSEAEFTAAGEAAAALAAYNDEPDDEAALAAIPLLTRQDVKREPDGNLGEERDGALLVDTLEGVDYARLMFDAGAAEPELGALAYLLGKLDTARGGFEDFSNRVFGELGGLSFHTDVIGLKGGYKPFVVVAAKALEGKAGALFGLAGEALVHTRFEDAGRIRSLLSELKAKLETEFLTRGHSHAMSYACSALFGGADWAQGVGGARFYEWLSALLSDFDARFEGLKARLEGLARETFTRARLTAVYGAGRAGFYDAAKAFTAGLEEGRGAELPVFTPRLVNDGFETAGQVQYCCAAADFGAAFGYGGRLRVLAGVLTDDYLMTEIRIKGGAYGMGADFSRHGAFTQFSYRDPHAKESFDVFDKAGEYLEGFRPSEREMDKYVLGAVNMLDRLLDEAAKVERAARLKVLGVSYEDLRREREEILSASAADMRGYAEKLKGLTAARCAFGARERLEAAGLAVRKLG